jgi:hypothetical protein
VQSLLLTRTGNNSNYDENGKSIIRSGIVIGQAPQSKPHGKFKPMATLKLSEIARMRLPLWLSKSTGISYVY